ncbi:MAG: hypothetical protein CXR31_01595 [Geobacter sp.]|nr:MAG: hypothetical protein CXR31_01595 [Geobacter sp.]
MEEILMTRKLFRILLLRRMDIRQSFLTLGCILICWNFLLLLAVVPAWGDPGRGLSGDDGNTHRVSINSSGYISIDVGQPVDGFFPNSGTPSSFKTYSSPYRMCREAIQVPGPGEGLAEFDAKIYYVYVADTPLQDAQGNYADSCTHGSNPGLSAWVAVFHEKDKKWLYNRHLGPVHTDNPGRGTGAGAAIVVFNSELYVFTDKQTYTSTDGYGWNATDPPVYNDISYEPLDAITIYPPIWGEAGTPGEGDPKVLIVYGRQTAAGNTYSQLLSGLWDGNAGSGLSLVQSISDVPSYGRASLTSGTVDTPDLNGWGQKVPVVQLFANAKPIYPLHAAGTIKHWENFYYYFWGTLATGPSWHADTLAYPAYGSTTDHLFVFPQYLAECIDDSKAPYQDLRQWIQVTWQDLGVPKQISFKSDALVPKNKDIPMTKCGEYGGTATDTAAEDPSNADVLKTRQHYWTLVGVILGTPPFSVNGYTAYSDFGPFSNVNYGTDETHQVESGTTMSNSVLASGGGEIHGGIKGVFKLSASIDWGYKHTWTHNFGDTSTQTVKKNDSFGTSRSSYSELGKWGWAIFNAPTLVLQNWQAYAYDYDPSTGVGHDLDQTLTTFQQDGATFQKANFELEDPGGPNDLYPGLLKGIAPFGCSRSLYDWYRFPQGIVSWETDSRWDARLGEKNVVNPNEESWSTKGQYLELKLQPLQFVPGSGSEPSFAQTTQHYDTEGQTNDVNVTVGASMSLGTAVNGMSAYLKAGYAGSFGWSTKTTTGFGTQLSFALDMKSCNVPGAGCVGSLSVQPYWLMPKAGDAGAGAPWIPTAYQNDRPWAIVWKASGATPLPTSPFICGTSTSSTLVSSMLAGSGLVGASSADDSRAGTAPPPANAFGRIVSGTGGGEPGDQYSHYIIEGGRLTWVETGTEERIPMTADNFDPSKGVLLEIHNFSWSSSSGNGAWSRSGNIWHYQPNGNVQENRVTLKLDFDAATYDLHIQKVDLNGRVPAGSRIVNLILTINQQYAFFTHLNHDVDIAWRWNQPAPGVDKAHLTSFQGRYDTAKKSGKVTIAGTLPTILPAFGDLSVNINGHPYLARLINIDGFQEAFENGGTIKYAKKGVLVAVDFGKKTWSATFNGEAFQELVVPQMGKFRANISVGGASWVKSEDAVLDYSANLTLVRR